MLCRVNSKVSTKIDIILEIIIEMNNHLNTDRLHILDMNYLLKKATSTVAKHRNISILAIKNKYTSGLNISENEFEKLLLNWFKEQKEDLKETLLKHISKPHDKELIELILD